MEDVERKYPLIYQNSRNYAARIIQRAWKRYMMRVVFKYFMKCQKEFTENLTPRELSRIYPEVLEVTDSSIPSKIEIKMMGESFPPSLVCRIMFNSTQSIDGKRHLPKWIPLFSSGIEKPVDQRALVAFFLEAINNV